MHVVGRRRDRRPARMVSPAAPSWDESRSCWLELDGSQHTILRGARKGIKLAAKRVAVAAVEGDEAANCKREQERQRSQKRRDERLPIQICVDNMNLAGIRRPTSVLNVEGWISGKPVARRAGSSLLEYLRRRQHRMCQIMVRYSICGAQVGRLLEVRLLD